MSLFRRVFQKRPLFARLKHGCYSHLGEGVVGALYPPPPPQGANSTAVDSLLEMDEEQLKRRIELDILLENDS